MTFRPVWNGKVSSKAEMGMLSADTRRLCLGREPLLAKGEFAMAEGGNGRGTLAVLCRDRGFLSPADGVLLDWADLFLRGESVGLV